jgi:hypothetical protein
MVERLRHKNTIFIDKDDDIKPKNMIFSKKSMEKKRKRNIR